MQWLHLGLVALAFLLCGHCISLNDTLIPYVQAQLNLSYTGVLLIQMAFFSGYFVSSPLSGLMVARIGFVRSMVLGMFLALAGALGIYLALDQGDWLGVLASVLFLGGGVGSLQVSGNPYAVRISGQAHHLVFVQGFTCIGMLSGPLLAASYVYPIPQLENYYLVLASAWCAVIGLGALLVPSAKEALPSYCSLRWAAGEFMRDRTLLYCALAVFLYVGAEIGVGSLLVAYLREPSVGGYGLQDAVRLSAFYWGGLMIGRFVGVPLLRKHGAGYMIRIHGVLAVFLMGLAVVAQGHLAQLAILATGYANSILFPALFGLGVQKIGDRSPTLAGLLAMSQVGGAIVPVLQGAIADMMSLRLSFLLPAICYCGILASLREIERLKVVRVKEKRHDSSSRRD